VRRAAHVPCWWKSSQTVLQAGSEVKSGGNASLGVEGIKAGKGRIERKMIYGDGEMGAELETLGMCARRLRVVDGLKLNAVTDGDADDAGQGAHREVGSEGFAANHRAVAEQGEPVGQIPDESEPALWRRSKYLEHLGASRCVRAARWERNMRYPGRSRTVPPRRGTGTWAYKPAGEVAGQAVREVGVTRGTDEPGNNRNPGIASSEGRRAGDQKGAGQGEGVTSGNGELSLRTGE
jgi:hypothetical protein